jgi:hypothetical protein
LATGDQCKQKLLTAKLAKDGREARKENRSCAFFTLVCFAAFAPAFASFAVKGFWAGPDAWGPFVFS